MLILTKAVLAMMIGFILSVIFGLFLIPLLKKINVKQNESTYLQKAHKAKFGTPTMGGLIFILPTILTMFILLLLIFGTFMQNVCFAEGDDETSSAASCCDHSYYDSCFGGSFFRYVR